jgi:hypothetical protein
MKSIISPILISVLLLLYSGIVSFIKPPKKVNKEHLMQFYRTNISAYEKTENQGNLLTKVRFIPKDFTTLMLLNEDEQAAINFQKEAQTALSFLVQLETPSIGNKEFLNLKTDTLNFEERIYYYSFNFRNDISYQIDNGQILSISDFHFERLFNISTYGNFNISIPTPNKRAKWLKIIIRDKIYDFGHTTFEFDLKKIKEFPRLKIETKTKSTTSK